MLIVIALAVSSRDPLQPAPDAAGLGPVHRQGLLRHQGRALDRAGRHAGAGPDGQRRRRRRSARSRRSSCADGKAIVTLRIEPKYKPDVPQRDGPAAAEDRPEGHGRRARPGRRRRRRPLQEGDTIPISQTLPDVNLDEILASLDADTRDYLTLLLTGGAEGLRGEGRDAGATMLRRFEPTARVPGARSTTRSRSGGSNIRRAVHNFSLLVDELGSQGRPDRELRAELQRGLRDRWRARTRTCARRCRSCPSTLSDDAEGARQAPTRWRRELGPTLQALRPGARALGPSLRETRPFLRQSTPIIRDEIRPFVRAARPAVKRPAAGAARPGGRHARPHAHVQGRQRAAEHARLQPARRPRRGLPVLALVGEPPRQHGVRHAGRARPDPPRHRRRVLPDSLAVLDSVARNQPAARRARAAAQPAAPGVPADHPGPGTGGG